MFFAEYAEADSGKGMTNDQLVAFAADCELLTPRLTKGRLTLVFDQLKVEGDTSISFTLFQETIREIATLREEKLVEMMRAIEADFVRAKVVRFCVRHEGGDGSEELLQPGDSAKIQRLLFSEDVPHVTIFTKYGDGTARHPVFRNSVYVKEVFSSMGFSVYNPNTDNPLWIFSEEATVEDTEGKGTWLLTFNQSIAHSRRTRGLLLLLDYGEEMEATLGTMSEAEGGALRSIPRIGVPVHERIEYTPSLAKKHCLLVRAAARRQWEGCGVDDQVVQLTSQVLIRILYAYCTHTVLILCSYCTHTVLILYLYRGDTRANTTRQGSTMGMVFTNGRLERGTRGSTARGKCTGWGSFTMRAATGMKASGDPGNAMAKEHATI
jgi:hypothetical protein